MLADELRQSSDDLTRMVRTYVVTGDPAFKKYYQDILDIRNGKRPRPDRYQHLYWDSVAARQSPPHPGIGKAVPLQALMQQAGFSEPEFRKLAEAQENSDTLTDLEFEAIKLAETVGPDAEAAHAMARLMLHDDKYHQDKYFIMKPIDDFYEAMEKRTTGAVQASETRATILRILFLFCGLSLVILLLRVKKVLDAILGASVDEVHTRIVRIGQGDLSAAPPVPAGDQDSVMGHLAEMQVRLKELGWERLRAEEEVEAQRKLLSEMAARVPGVLYQFYSSPSGEKGFYYVSPRMKELFGVEPLPEEKVFENFAAAVVPECRESFLESNARAVREVSEWKYEGRLRKPSGEEVWFSGHSIPSRHGEEIIFNGILEEITERKHLEEERRKNFQELEVFYKATMGREGRILELREEVERLRKELGK